MRGVSAAVLAVSVVSAVSAETAAVTRAGARAFKKVAKVEGSGPTLV